MFDLIMTSIPISSFLILSLFPLSSITSHLQLFNNHHHQRSTLTKRGDGFHGRATFYATGLGSCGDTNTDSDYIVALNQAQYDSSWCGKTITITYGGKSTQATVKDLCPGCPFGALDMSPSLFKYFASEDVGVFYMSWSVGGGGGGGSGGGDDDKPKEKPAPVYVPPPPAPKPDPPKVEDKPDPPKVQDKPDPPKPEDKPDPPKPEDKPDPKPVYQPSTPPPVSVSTTPSPWNFSRSATSNNTPSSGKVISSTTTTTTSVITNTVAMSKGYVPTVYGEVEIASAYDAGGNLDIVSQLIISFGSLTAASASHAIGQ